MGHVSDAFAATACGDTAYWSPSFSMLQVRCPAAAEANINQQMCMLSWHNSNAKNEYSLKDLSRMICVRVFFFFFIGYFKKSDLMLCQ